MPKRDVQTIQHSSITNHRILARPGEPFPEITFQQTTKALPNLVHLNPAPGQKELAPPALTLLQAYGELLETHPEYSDRYSVQLNELEKAQPDSALVQSALGRRDLRAGKYQEAIGHLQHAIAIGPAQATMYSDLAQALEKLDRREEALEYQQKAIALDPFNPLLQKAQIVSYINLKQYANAMTALQHYLEIFPQDSFMRHMLDLATTGAHPQ
jgi:tetratricopeptide (TPR) repeat protein